MIDLVPAAEVHADLMAAMHKVCFAEPWTAAGFLEGLRAPGTFGLIAVDRGTLVPSDGSQGGPAGLVLWRAVLDEAEILSICVLPPWRRQGLGEKMLRAALEHVAEAGDFRMFLEVADNNPAALALYEKLGFHHIFRRKNYYSDADALVMGLAAPSYGPGFDPNQ